MLKSWINMFNIVLKNSENKNIFNLLTICIKIII